MDLWIRSQDKQALIKPSLIKVNEIKLGKYEKEIDEVLQPKYTKLYPCLIVNSYFVVGIYEKEERALEVLDEIQKLLIDCSSLKISRLNLNNGYDDLKIPYEINTKIYEMPKE